MIAFAESGAKAFPDCVGMQKRIGPSQRTHGDVLPCPDAETCASSKCWTVLMQASSLAVSTTEMERAEREPMTCSHG